ncbi:MAG TPA: alkaline phosphatase PhoX [Bauldia sp.]|nr:alkaline phosphatase PhoX [Bauldia sp.]
MASANFSDSDRPVNVNLAAGVATRFTGDFGTITTEAPMLAGEGGFRVVPLFTVGETLRATTGALNPSSAGDYTAAGVLDGIGAFRLDASTVRVLVNHELSSAAPYAIADGSGGAVSLAGARISYFDLDIATMAIVDAGLAIRSIHARSGALVSGEGQLETPAGLQRLCSSVLVEPSAYGPGRGLADRIYLTGEEVSSPHGGSVWALDTASGDLWAVPAMGRGKWENAAPLDTGDSSHVAFLLTDDSSGAALYLYVGEKHAGGDFLDRNGLRDGQLFVWKSDSGDLSPSDFPSGTRAGTFVPLAVRDPGRAGDPGYDEQGYLDAATLTAAADGLGAFSFRRPEDVDANPANPSQAVFATTGIPSSSDNAGTIYTVTLDFTDPSNPAADIRIAYNANFDPARQIRNPDNLDWSGDGFVYVQEGPASPGLFGEGAVNPHEASILRLNAANGAVVRVAEIDRAAVGPFGATDGSPGAAGAWESSGIVDVSLLFGRPAGTLFLADVQAHTVVDGPIAALDLSGGGQLVLIAAPGAAISPAVESIPLGDVDKVIGSRFDDTIVGDAAGNLFRGGKGGDRLDGAAGDDRLNGGPGNDEIIGRDGDDRIGGGAGSDELTGGAGRDLFVFLRPAETPRKLARADIVEDFEPGLDRLHLAAIDAGPGKGDQAFHWIGGRGFHDRPGELRYKQRDLAGSDDDVRIVEGDIDGNGRADFRIVLAGLGELDRGDFVL